MRVGRWAWGAAFFSQVGLLGGQFDLAVHSLKDMPTTLPEGLVLAAISEVSARVCAAYPGPFAHDTGTVTSMLLACSSAWVTTTA